MLGITDLSVSVLLQHTYADRSNEAVVLTAVGFTAFHFGVSFLRKIPECWPPAVRAKSEDKYRLFSWIMLLLLSSSILIYMAAGLTSADEGRYSDLASTSATGDGIYFLITLFSIVSVALIAAVLAQKRVPEFPLWVSGSIILMWAGRMLVNGDRNNFFLIVVAAGVGYCTFIRKTSAIAIACALFISLSLYKAVEVVRFIASVTFSYIHGACGARSNI